MTYIKPIPFALNSQINILQPKVVNSGSEAISSLEATKNLIGFEGGADKENIRVNGGKIILTTSRLLIDVLAKKNIPGLVDYTLKDLLSSKEGEFTLSKLQRRIIFKQIESLISNIKVAKNVLYACPCGFKSNRNTNLKFHMNAIHIKHPIAECKVHEMFFCDPKYAVRHFDRHHKKIQIRDNQDLIKNT